MQAYCYKMPEDKARYEAEQGGKPMTSGGRDASDWGLFNIQTESRKGTDCPYKPITCVEGFCSGCQIYLNFKGH